MISFDCPTNRQGRLTLNPIDGDGNAVVLDPNALTVLIIEGNGTFEYNPATNGLVFRSEDTAVDLPVTKFHVEGDAQPGSGVTLIPFDVEMRSTPVGAVALGEGVVLEAKGVAA